MQPGQHVGILATNCVEWVEAMFAVYKIRASVVNVNFRYVEDELRYLFDNSDMVALVYQREYGPLVAAARDAQPQLQTFVRIEWASMVMTRTPTIRRSAPLEFESLLAAHSPERDFEERSDDDVYLLYTGGTTGMPKGVMWRQEDVYFALAGGIDVFTGERVKTPSEPSERIDATATVGTDHDADPAADARRRTDERLALCSSKAVPRSSPTCSTPTRCGARSNASG